MVVAEELLAFDVEGTLDVALLEDVAPARIDEEFENAGVEDAVEPVLETVLVLLVVVPVLSPES